MALDGGAGLSARGSASATSFFLSAMPSAPRSASSPAPAEIGTTPPVGPLALCPAPPPQPTRMKVAAESMRRRRRRSEPRVQIMRGYLGGEGARRHNVPRQRDLTRD